MVGFITRLRIVLGWLHQLSKRGELKPLLKVVLVLTLKDLHFFSQVILARFIVWLETHRQRALEESLKREGDKRRQSIALRRRLKAASHKRELR